MSNEEQRDLVLAVTGIKELMEANFRTVHVRLDALATLSPEVEALKREVSALHTEMARRAVVMENLDRRLAHLDVDFMPREEMHKTFLSIEEADDRRDQFMYREELFRTFVTQEDVNRKRLYHWYYQPSTFIGLSAFLAALADIILRLTGTA